MPTTHDGLHYEFSEIEGFVEVIYDAAQKCEPQGEHRVFEFLDEFGLIERIFIW